MRIRAALLTCALLTTYALAALPVGEAAGARVRFGIGTDGIDAMSNAGVKPEYTQTWVGTWTKSNWGGFDSVLKTAKSKGVTLVIEWYYWGDGINSNCLDNGCNGKSRSEWKSMTRTMAQKIKASGASTIVVVESEFNKNDIDDWYASRFDGHLKEIISIIRAEAPGAKVAIGFGNWGSDKWYKFSGAVSAADYTGFQAMAASTRHSVSAYLATDNNIESTTKKLKSQFGKPVILHDLALASYPAPEWEGHQKEFMKQLFGRMGTLAGSGLDGIVWRYYKDNCYSSGYFGAAECYWGLSNKHGSPKPAWWTWVEGIKAHRGGSPTPTPTDGGSSGGTGGGGSFSATFTPTRNGNEWWVETKVDPSGDVKSVEASINGGGWIALEKKSWGAWAKSTRTPDGSKVQFRATNWGGATAYSGHYLWPSATPTDGGSSGGGGAGGAFSASFTPKDGNEWWVQAFVSSGQGIAKVEASVNGGGWIALEKKSWGAWAKSMHAPPGSKVQFRATSSSGDTALSPHYVWPSGAIADGGSSGGGFSTTFKLGNTNEWWIEAYVGGSEGLKSVEASVNGGGWTPLEKKSWGAWAKSTHVPGGSKVQFRATNWGGATAYSGHFTL